MTKIYCVCGFLYNLDRVYQCPLCGLSRLEVIRKRMHSFLHPEVAQNAETIAKSHENEQGKEAGKAVVEHE